MSWFHKEAVKLYSQFPKYSGWKKKEHSLIMTDKQQILSKYNRQSCISTLLGK